MITSKIIADSVSTEGIRLTTIETYAPKFIDAEFEKHRMLSSNSSSSRAIPFGPLKDIYIPDDIRQNQKGMQGYRPVSMRTSKAFKSVAKVMYDNTMAFLNGFDGQIHKQHLNRYIEPWTMQRKIVTATEWDNFYTLRTAEDAQPEMRALALSMQHEMDKSVPKKLKVGEWHLPYITEDDYDWIDISGGYVRRYPIEELRKISAARCARVSFNNHDGSKPNPAKDLKLAKFLLDRVHMTPFEHQATPMEHTDDDLYYLKDTGPYDNAFWDWTEDSGISHLDRDGNLWSANLRGWVQNRKLVE